METMSMSLPDQMRDWLQQAITEGLNSGEAEAFDMQNFLRNLNAKHLG